MKLKLLRYWWDYNNNHLDCSLLFVIVRILLSPYYILLIVGSSFKEGILDGRKRRKEFWESYKETFSLSED